MKEKVSIQIKTLFTIAAFVAMFFIGIKIGEYRTIESKFDIKKALEKGSTVILSKELSSVESFSIEKFVENLKKSK